MKNNVAKFPQVLVLLLVVWLAGMVGESQADALPKIKALIIDGQNNHDWKTTTPLLKAALESSGRFDVAVATTPPSGSDLGVFHPDFAKYGVIVLNYNGEDWPEPTQKAFEAYMKNGGGMVSVHAADNSFAGWAEYNKMIGVGGWGGRNSRSGAMLRWREGKVEKDTTGRAGGTHGNFFPWLVETRQPEHPIMQGLPASWLHTPDELYATLVGPAENVTVLATAKSDVTGENEPILMVIRYGKGRVFHTTMGHKDVSINDVGFITTLDRGAEWAATGQVTQPVPKNFPTAEKTSPLQPASN